MPDPHEAKGNVTKEEEEVNYKGEEEGEEEGVEEGVEEGKEKGEGK